MPGKATVCSGSVWFEEALAFFFFVLVVFLDGLGSSVAWSSAVCYSLTTVRRWPVYSVNNDSAESKFRDGCCGSAWAAADPFFFFFLTVLDEPTPYEDELFILAFEYSS